MLPSVNKPNGDKFIQDVMKGKSMHESAKEAGFSHPQRDAYKLLFEQKAQDYARRFVKAQCIIQGAPQAYKFMYATMQDPKQDIRVRVVCAREIMGYGEIVAPKGAKSPDGPAQVDPSKMNKQELIEYMKLAQHVLAENAKLIESEPQTIEDIM